VAANSGMGKAPADPMVQGGGMNQWAAGVQNTKIFCRFFQMSQSEFEQI
jgi:hypothetical protein